MNLMTGAVNALFSFKPFFRFAARKAREMMQERGEAIGHPWGPGLAALSQHDWDAELARVRDSELEYPDYYVKPFHAYENGNLSWDAALEADLAARAVHATVFDPLRNELDPEGDRKLRESYHEKLKGFLAAPRCRPPASVVDIGCATGLSTFALLEAFPEASRFVGVDLSPFFLAVANYRLRERFSCQGKEEVVTFIHAAGEDTKLPAESADLVSMCLVAHELPRSATCQVIAEARRILRPGGALAIMEMDPRSPFLQKMVDNVFAFTAFKATEPYFDDYRTFPIEDAIAAAGFSYPQQAASSPRHRTIVAFRA